MVPYFYLALRLFFFMLNSSVREILKAHKYKTIKKFLLSQTQNSLENYFSYT